MSTPDQWLDVAAIARLTGWSPGYVRKRASTDAWKRAGTKPQKYSARDVSRSVPESRDTRKKTHLVTRYS
jgi:hypothetical protein